MVFFVMVACVLLFLWFCEYCSAICLYQDKAELVSCLSDCNNDVTHVQPPCRPVFTTVQHKFIEEVFMIPHDAGPLMPDVLTGSDQSSKNVSGVVSASSGAEESGTLCALRKQLTALPVRDVQLIYSVTDGYGLMYCLKPTPLSYDFIVRCKVVISASTMSLAIQYLTEKRLKDRLFENPCLYKQYKTIDEEHYVRRLRNGKAGEHIVAPAYFQLAQWNFISSSQSQRQYAKDCKNYVAMENSRGVVYTRPTVQELDRVQKLNIDSGVDDTLRGCTWAGCTEPPRTGMSKCARCRRSNYCCRQHQVLDYPSHKLACQHVLDRHITDVGAYMDHHL
jgi:hypothetical protein